jgi:hypothetical protein
MEFLGVLLTSVCVFIVGIVIYDAYKIAMFEKYINEKLEQDLEEVKSKIIHTELVFESNSLLLYNKETNEFIAQANTWDELNEILSERYPDYFFHLENEIMKKAKLFNK